VGVVPYPEPGVSSPKERPMTKIEKRIDVPMRGTNDDTNVGLDA